MLLLRMLLSLLLACLPSIALGIHQSCWSCCCFCYFCRAAGAVVAAKGVAAQEAAKATGAPMRESLLLPQHQQQQQHHLGRHRKNGRSLHRLQLQPSWPHELSL